MDGQKYVIFHNDSDTSYMNTTANFRGADTATQVINLYFESPISSSVGPSAYDKIVLAITAGKEEKALNELAGMFAGTGPKGRTTIIADDVNSKYAVEDISSLTSITTATSATLRKMESITPAGDGTGGAADANTRILTAADSGTTFLCNISSNTAAFRLPAPVAGLNYKFILDVTSDAENTKDLIVSTASNSVNIIGVALDAGGVHDVVPTTSVLSLDTSDGVAGAGDRFGIVCDGTNYYVEDATALTTGIFNVADNAI